MSYINRFLIRAAAAGFLGSLICAPAYGALISFEGFTPGTVVTDQFDGVVFSSSTPSGNMVLGEIGGPLGQFICADGCIADTYLDFTTPVNGLSFWGIEANATGPVAEFNIFENGVFSATVVLIGPGMDPDGGNDAAFIDLSAFTNVTRLEIVNILDDATAENGIGWDEFQFTPVPLPGGVLLLSSALGVIALRRRREVPMHA